MVFLPRSLSFKTHHIYREPFYYIRNVKKFRTREKSFFWASEALARKMPLKKRIVPILSVSYKVYSQENMRGLGDYIVTKNTTA